MAGEVARLVRCSSHKHEDLSSNPQHPSEKAGTVALDCNPSAEEVEKDGSKVLIGQPAYPDW